MATLCNHAGSLVAKNTGSGQACTHFSQKVHSPSPRVKSTSGKPPAPCLIILVSQAETHCPQAVHFAKKFAKSAQGGRIASKPCSTVCSVFSVCKNCPRKNARRGKVCCVNSLKIDLKWLKYWVAIIQFFRLFPYYSNGVFIRLILLFLILIKEQ